MENRAHAIAAGIFLLVMGLAMIAAVAWFQGDHKQRSTYVVVSKSGVAGLNIKAPVKLRGVEVGKVEDIDFDPTDPRQVLVKIAVERTAPITQTTFAQLGLQGVTGLSFIALEDDGKGDLRPAVPGQPAPRIELRPTFLDRLAIDGPKLIDRLFEATRRVNQLLGDDNQAQVKSALAGLSSGAGEVSKLVASLQPSARALPTLLQHADAVVLRADATASKLDTLAADAIALAQELRGRVATLDRIGTAAQQIEATVQNLELSLVGPNPLYTRPLVAELSGASRAIQSTANDIRAQPQSLLFGHQALPPGPGETGFDERSKSAR